MADDSSTRLAKNIKRLREEAGLSQKGLAEQSGVPRPTIAHLESGQANPTLSVVIKVASALCVNIDGLMEEGEAPLLILPPRSLPTERTSRIRRVKVLSAGNLRDPEIERITVKAGGRIRVSATSRAPALLVCEKGEFSLVSGPKSATLAPERVARVTSECDCFGAGGGVIYLVTGK
jgi:transcriptional regulator with XRE-family HTH domain